MARFEIRGPSKHGTYSVVDTKTGEVLMSGLDKLGAKLFLEDLLKHRKNPKHTTWNVEKAKYGWIIRGPKVIRGPFTSRAKACEALKRENPQLLVIGNPASSEELQDAIEAYREFHGVDPKYSSKVPNGEGRVLIALGELKRIDYKPSRGERSGPTWYHHFRPGVVLAASPDGKQLFIVDRKSGKRLVDWKLGIVR